MASGLAIGWTLEDDINELVDSIPEYKKWRDAAWENDPQKLNPVLIAEGYLKFNNGQWLTHPLIFGLEDVEDIRLHDLAPGQRSKQTSRYIGFWINLAVDVAGVQASEALDAVRDLVVHYIEYETARSEYRMIAEHIDTYDCADGSEERADVDGYYGESIREHELYLTFCLTHLEALRTRPKARARNNCFYFWHKFACGRRMAPGGALAERDRDEYERELLQAPRCQSACHSAAPRRAMGPSGAPW